MESLDENKIYFRQSEMKILQYIGHFRDTPAWIFYTLDLSFSIWS